MRDTDSHTIYFVTTFTEEEVTARLQGMFDTLQNDESLPRDLDYEYRLNYVQDKNRLVNFGYLYMCDKRVFWSLLNKNIDGTDRTISVYVVPDSETEPVSGDGSRSGSSRRCWVELTEEDERRYKVVPAPVRFPYEREFNMRPASPLHNLHHDQSPNVLVVRGMGSLTPNQLTEALSVFVLPSFRIINHNDITYLMIPRDDDSFRFLQPLFRSFRINNTVVSMVFCHREVVRELMRSSRNRNR